MPATPALLKMYADELEEHLQKWEASCLKLHAKESVDTCIQELFRYAHNLKAGAQIIEFNEVAKQLHRLEDYLAALKNKKVEYRDEALDLFDDAATYLKECLNGIKTGELKNSGSTALDEKLQSLMEASGRAVNQPKTAAELDAIINKIIEDRAKQPPAEAAQNSAALVGQIQQSLAVPVEKKQKAAPKAEDITTKVKLSQLDHLIRLIGELSIENETMGSVISAYQKESSLQQSWSRSRKILRDLQNTALSLRMQTVDGLFMRLEKSASDAARKLNKKVIVKKIGTEVELDKQIIEKIAEPLTHMVRNAVDHGIEVVAVRKFSEKSETGSLTLEAFDAGGTIQLIIEDDGKGIDAEKVFQKAVENGLVKKDANLSDNEKRQLVFLPGFSTAEAVTEFSGRGVGMDVVKTLMDSLGGEIEIQSEIGKGTRFILHIPTTVSILNALIVNVEGINYAIPTQDLREIVNLADHEVKYSSQNKPFFVLRDNVVAIRKISEFVQIGSHRPEAVSEVPQSHDRQPTLVVKAGESVIGFPVEKILSQQRLNIRPVPESLHGISGAIGTAILTGGEASLILNLPSIVRRISLGA